MRVEKRLLLSLSIAAILLVVTWKTVPRLAKYFGSAAKDPAEELIDSYPPQGQRMDSHFVSDVAATEPEASTQQHSFHPSAIDSNSIRDYKSVKNYKDFKDYKELAPIGERVGDPGQGPFLPGGLPSREYTPGILAPANIANINGPVVSPERK